LAVIGVYWMYALSIVPLIEPAVEAMPQPQPVAPSPNQPRHGGRSETNRELFKRYFAEGAWELQNPKVLENEKAKVLVKDYQTQKDGRVRLTPCTMMFFPKGESPDAEPIIMQAPEGALLEFDPP